MHRLSCHTACFILAAFIGMTASHGQAQSLSITANIPQPNFRIYPSNVTQTEVFVAQHPANANLLFLTANTINLATGFISEGIYVSTDGGVQWRGNDTCTGSPLLFHRGDPGIAIDKNGTFILIRLGFQDGLFSHFSTDNGLSWSSQKTIAEERQDRASLVTDHNQNSKFYGRTYTGYVELLPPFPVKIAYSNDGGAVWSAPFTVNNPLQRSQGAELAVGKDSTLYAIWAGVLSTSPFTEDFIGFAVSNDGGLNWNVAENVIDMNGIQGVLSQKSSIRVNGLPKIDVDKTTGPRSGWIYLVTTQKNLLPAGSDPDIVFYRSTDRGASWSNGVRVNQDGFNNGKIQYFPAIHVDAGGGVNILYYDDRLATSDSVGVFLSRSTDGGSTWSDYQISDHHFKPQSIGGLGQGYQGDNIALTSVNGTLLPFWMDNVSGIYQIWTSRVPISTLVGVQETEHTPDNFSVKQNYPNPFNPSTTIVFQLSQKSSVSLNLFDLLGREVYSKKEIEYETGTHQITLSAPSSLSSGVYFYQLSAGRHTAIRKCILLR